MKVLVPLKQVDDPGNTEINGSYDFTRAGAQGMSKIINPFCHVALEEAVRLKEQGIASEVVLVCICDKNPEKTLRKALAGGADRAIDIRVESEKQLSPLSTTKIFKQIVAQEQPDLVLFGRQSVDYDNNQIAQMLATLLGWNQAHSAAKMAIEGNRATVDVEADDGEITLAFDLPAVISVDLCMNEQRAASLAHTMKARSKKIDVLNIADVEGADSFGIGASKLAYQDTIVPKIESNLTMLQSVDDLVAEIKKHSVQLV